MKKKLYETIKLRKFGCKLDSKTLESFHGDEFIVIFWDNTCKAVYREELISVLEKDHLKKVRFIFDFADRIILDRDIKIDINEIKGGEI